MGFSRQILWVHNLGLSVVYFLTIESGKYVVSETFDDVFDSWDDLVSYGDPGFIGLQLDRFLETQGCAHLVVSLIEGGGSWIQCQRLIRVLDIWATARDIVSTNSTNSTNSTSLGAGRNVEIDSATKPAKKAIRHRRKSPAC